MTNVAIRTNELSECFELIIGRLLKTLLYWLNVFNKTDCAKSITGTILNNVADWNLFFTLRFEVVMQDVEKSSQLFVRETFKMSVAFLHF